MGFKADTVQTSGGNHYTVALVIQRKTNLSVIYQDMSVMLSICNNITKQKGGVFTGMED
jgi:hypothetical protein